MKKNEINSLQELDYIELENTIGGNIEAKSAWSCVCVGELEEVDIENMADAEGIDSDSSNKNARKTKRNS